MPCMAAQFPHAAADSCSTHQPPSSMQQACYGSYLASFVSQACTKYQQWLAGITDQSRLLYSHAQTAHKAAVAAAAAVPPGMPFAGTGHMCKAALSFCTSFTPVSRSSSRAMCNMCFQQERVRLRSADMPMRQLLRCGTDGRPACLHKHL